MLIIGIDPGEKYTAYCIYEKGSEKPIIAHWCDTFSLDDDLYKQVFYSIRIAINRCSVKPQLVIIESFNGRNSFTREVIGVIKYVLGVKKIDWREITPGHIKKMMTGKGNASKGQVIDAVNAKFGLSLNNVRRHEADAVAIAYCCKDLELE